MTVLDSRPPIQTSVRESATEPEPCNPRLDLEQVFAAVGCGMRVIDKDSNMILVNDAFLEMVGLSREDALSMKCYEAMAGPQCHTPCCPLARIMAGEERVEYEIEKWPSRSDKMTTLLTATPLLNPDGGLVGIVEDFRDISVRKKMENKLRESEEKFSKAFHSNVSLMTINAVDGGAFLEVNDAFLETLEYERDEVVARQPEDLDLLVDLNMKARVDSLMGETGSVSNTDAAIKTKSGKVRHGLFSAHTVELQGRLCVLTIFNDVTERKKTEDNLRESEEKFSKAFYSNSAQMTINAVDEGVFLDVNDAFLETQGYERHEIIGRRLSDLSILADKKNKAKVDSLIAENGSVSNIDLATTTKSGEVRHGLFSAQPIELQGKPCVLTIMSDVTERTLAEQRLEEAHDALTAERTMLEHKNVALKEVIGQVEERRQNSGQRLRENVESLVLPVVKTISSVLGDKDRYLIDLLETSLGSLLDPVANWQRQHSDLSPREREICGMIKQGFRSKDIAKVFNTSEGTVEQQRKGIRRKLGLRGSGGNLTSYLRSR